MPYQTFDEMANAEPLVRFSFYLAGRVQVLLGIQSEILGYLNNLSADGPIDFDRVATAERLSWLWILGAYEVVRTMCQAKHVCLSDTAARSIQKLKRNLARARIPAAKMEQQVPQGTPPTPVLSSRSPFGIDLKRRDLLVGDPTNPVSLRELLQAFRATMCGFQSADIVASHESSYARAG